MVDRTIRTMITENSTRKTEARAFSFFAFAGNLGLFIGPLLGESRPLLRLPRLSSLLTAAQEVHWPIPLDSILEHSETYNSSRISHMLFPHLPLVG